MPELSRFFGIVIRMFLEAAGPHHTPHFRAYYADHVGVFGINPVELLAGELPKRQQRLVEAWAELHSAELEEDWKLLQSGNKPKPINPLS
jgi:hypothetical protein